MSPNEIKLLLSGSFVNLAETLRGAASFTNLFCYQNAGDASTVYYIPLSIAPEKGLQKQKQFGLIATGSTNLLQLGCRWDIDRSLLGKLNDALLEKLKPENVTAITFAVPPVSVQEVRLELANDEHAYNTLQTSKSSGFFPFNTIFNLMIDSRQKDRVLHAMNGTAGYLRVRFFASVQVNNIRNETVGEAGGQQITITQETPATVKIEPEGDVAHW